MNTVIKKAIEIAGSQVELARRTGYSQAGVHRWLKGSDIEARAFRRIIAATGGQITLEEIVDSLEDKGRGRKV